MKSYQFIVLAALCLLTTKTYCQVNPNASQSCTNLLNFMSDMSSSCELVYGQNLGSGNEANTLFGPTVANLQQETGEWLGMIGGDYGGWNPVNYSSMNQVFIDYWNANRMVTLSWHPRNPWTGNDSWDTTNQGEFDQLMTPGTSVYSDFQSSLSEIADALEELQDNGVAVLWRPWHEANGDWFWWGHPTNANSNQDYIDFWIYTFNYFTYERNLNNLLWVFNSAESWNNPTNFCYPGNQYVDMVSLDIYQDNMSWTSPADYSNLINTGKPFALGEYGPAISNPEGDYDWNVVHNFIKNNYPEVAYVLVWHSWAGHDNALIDNLNAGTILSDPCVQNERSISPPPPGNDEISNLVAPDLLIPGMSVNISITYEASTTRDIVVVFQLDESPWTAFSDVRYTVQAGSNTLVATIDIPSNTPQGIGLHQIQTILAPVGGGWDNRLDNLSQGNIDCIEESYDDAIVDLIAPGEIYQNENANVIVDYSANGDREIIILLQEDSEPWTVYAEQRVTVQQGEGTLNVTLPTEIPVGQNLYQISAILAPVGGGWDNRIDVQTITDIDCIQGLEDLIISIESPFSVAPEQTVNISVNYEASTNRDIHVVFQMDNAPWTFYSEEIISVTAGTGTQNISFFIPSNTPIANDEYKFGVFICPSGQGWDQRLDNQENINIDCVENENRPTSSSDQRLNSDLVVFPNPTNGIINIKGIDTFENLYVYNTGGKLLKEIRLNSEEIKIDLAELDIGIYVLQFNGKNKQVNKRLVISE